jgi:hypothetical protein
VYASWSKTTSFERKKLRYLRDIFTDYRLSVIALAVAYPQANALYGGPRRLSHQGRGTYG